MADPAQHPPVPEPAAGNALLDQMAQQHLAGTAAPEVSATDDGSLSANLESQLANLMSQVQTAAAAPPAAPASAPAPAEDEELSADLESQLANLMSQVQSVAASPPAAPASAAPPTEDKDFSANLESQLTALLAQSASAASPAAPVDSSDIDALVSRDADKIVAAASADGLPPLDPRTQTTDFMSNSDIDALLQAGAGNSMWAAAIDVTAAEKNATPDVQEKLTQADSVLEAELQKLMTQSLTNPAADLLKAESAKGAGTDTLPEISSIGVPGAAAEIAPQEMTEGEIESVAPSRRRRRAKRTGPSLIWRLGKMLADLLVMLLQLLDMPFVDFPAEIKGILGVVGVTLATTGVVVLGYVFIKH